MWVPHGELIADGSVSARHVPSVVDNGHDWRIHPRGVVMLYSHFQRHALGEADVRGRVERGYAVVGAHVGDARESIK